MSSGELRLEEGRRPVPEAGTPGQTPAPAAPAGAGGNAGGTSAIAQRRPLGHHLFSSFAGQRTVHCSPWLIAWQPLLEERAQAAYHSPGAWEAVHRDGLWLATFVVANGVDHVGRARQLVHQIALRDEHVPAIFSPLWLRRGVLPRLDSPDPAAVAARLAGDLAQLDLRSQMPDPARFARLLRSPQRAAAGALLHALARPDRPLDQPVRGLAAEPESIAALLCVPLLHQPICRIGTIAPLPWPGAAGTPTLRLRDYDPVRGLSGETMFQDGGFYPSDWILDLIADAAQPPRLLALLRRIPLAGLLAAGAGERLGPVLRGLAGDLERDGTPGIDPLHPESGAWLAALAAAGAGALAAAVLAQQRERLRAAGRLSAQRDAATNAAILDPTPHAVLAAATA